MEVAPFTITQPISIQHVLPANWQEGRLTVRFIDDTGHCHAHEFLDVATAAVKTSFTSSGIVQRA
jgi:hypothetical protein